MHVDNSARNWFAVTKCTCWIRMIPRMWFLNEALQHPQNLTVTTCTWITPCFHSLSLIEESARG